MWHHNTRLLPKEIKTLNRLIAGHDYGNYWPQKLKLVDKRGKIHKGMENKEHKILNFICDVSDGIRLP